MVPEIGQRFGPYEILGRLGGGGMGLVFRAWDARLQREVAIKLRVLEGDRRLRRNHLQHRDTRGGKNAWQEIVFEVENAD